LRPKSVVFDAWAILAWLSGEPGGEYVQRFFEETKKGKMRIFMSFINMGEVFYILAKRAGFKEALEVKGLLLKSPVKFILPSERQIWKAAEIKARYPVSYADAFAIALSLIKEAPLVTGDPEIKRLENKESLSLIWIRK